MAPAIASAGLQARHPAAFLAGRGPVKQRGVRVQSGDSEDIYIGFPKNDYAPREGRKGRVIKDDPAKYPDRDAFAGGWAGGEAGLWKFREEIKEELSKQQEAPPAPKPNGKPIPGKKPVYVGHSKEDMSLKNAGVPGRVIYDDEEKYPNKEDIGPLAGVTGGFAGGELGVKSFAETGEVRLRKPGEPGGQPISALSVGFLLLLGGGLGGVVLASLQGEEGGEGGEGISEAVMAVKEGVVAVAQAPVDDSTKTALLIGGGVVGALALLFAAQSAISSLSQKFKESAETILVYSGFALAVFLAARAVLEI